MTKLSEWLYLSHDDEPYVNFEASLEKDAVASGYVPVKSTLDVFAFLKEATAMAAPRGRAVICHGPYGTGKSRMCTVLARLLKDGFDCLALQPVWQRLVARGQNAVLTELKQAMMPGGRRWKPWLVVPMFASAGGGTLSAALIRALVKALRRAGLDDSVLGQTIYHAAARRLEEIIQGGHPYAPQSESPYSSAEQLKRALEQDLDERALNEFREFHKRVTVGMSFDLTHASEVLNAEDVYNTVAQKIQRDGYDGIVVLWDEFGFALEELLRGTGQRIRSLGQEAMSLQQFVECSCRSNELGRRIVFLGFAHVSIPEYGTREGLNETDRNRLATVSGRFRTPDIFVRLSVTETEGYHLLAGMIHRTPAGEAVLQNPSPKLQQIAERMPSCELWKQLSPSICYQDVVAPCYPLHPSTAAGLLQISDQIAQVNRTTFYYLQNQQEGGFAGALLERELPSMEEIGGKELLRISDLFRFFEHPIKETRRTQFDQYEEAAARFPKANDLDLSVLRTVLLLSVIKNPDMAPTTSFLSFCLCDALKEEEPAKAIHESLTRLGDAHALWKNEATDVWGFVGERGLGSDIDRKLEEERALIPVLPACELLRRYPQAQQEIADRLGDNDLDPVESGIVRTVGVRFLDIGAGEMTVEEVNPALNGGGKKWRSALVYLAAVDSASQLDSLRNQVAALRRNNIYFVFPPAPLALGSEKVRELIAVQHLLANTESESHTYEVLEAKLTRIRRELRDEFERTFGNEGLRAGTEVVRASDPPIVVQVNSWNELLPAIGSDLDSECRHQIRVRCGSYNEWQTGARWSPIEKVVERILQFDDHTPYQAEYLEFNETSQEAAVVDGVLVENGFLTHNALTGKWELVRPTPENSPEILREILRHFQTGGSSDKEFSRLYAKLIEPPFSVPNGVIPLLLALVFRAEPSKIGVYERVSAQLQRVSDAQVPSALVGMARSPDRFTTRYTKLTGKQRFVFKAIGPEMNVAFSDRVAIGERFYEYCEQVRRELKTWAVLLPEGALSIPELTDSQKKLLKVLRTAVPPQLPLLADHLVQVVADDPNTREELADSGGQLTSFPQTTRLWRELRTRISRYVDGVKAPVRSAIRELVKSTADETGFDVSRISDAIKPLETFASDNASIRQMLLRLNTAPDGGDVVERVAAAIANKAPQSLNDEDFGRAAGMLEMVAAIGLEANKATVVLPAGEKRVLPSVDHCEAKVRVERDVHEWRQSFGLSSDQIAALAIEAIFAATDRQSVSTAADTDEASPSTQAESTDPPPALDNG